MLVNDKAAPLVEILLATKNGEAYLHEQLDSLIKQTHRPIRVLVRDDGSRDRTLDILKEYQEKHPDIFTLLYDCDANLGVVENFFRLMQTATAEYIMFCDQDDVWKTSKVEEMLLRMKGIEVKHPDLPVIVHCDLIVVDKELKTISSSFLSYRGLEKISKLPNLLVQNNVTGCAMLLNKKAIKVSLPYNDAAIMHDWWVACNVLYQRGVIFFMPKALVYYRQHENNIIGAKRKSFKNYLKNPRNFFDAINRYKAVLHQSDALGYTGFFSKLRLVFYKVRTFITQQKSFF